MLSRARENSSGVLLCVAVLIFAGVPFRAHAAVAHSLPVGRAAPQKAATPALQSRSAEDDAEATAIDERVTAPVTIPADASGRYDFNHDRDSIEADFDAHGLTGYITIMAAHAGHAEPLTYFFAATTTAGSHIHFITHQVHRTRYEFDGIVTDAPSPYGGLAREYTLRGTLTTHQVQPGGPEETQSKAVTFKRFRYTR